MFTFKVRKLFRKAFGPWVSASPPRPKPRPTFKPRLDVLEDRCCPSGGVPDAGGGGGGGGGATDTLIWNPQNSSTNANDQNNWLDSTQGKQGIMLPGASNPVILSGSTSNSAIQLNGTLNCASFTVENNYNNTFTLNNGYFGTSDTDTVEDGCTLTLVSFVPQGILLSNANTFTVQSGATLKLSDPPQPAPVSSFLAAAKVNEGEILKNNGTVTWSGTSMASGKQAIIDGIGAPVLNLGTFNADGGTKGVNGAVGGQLVISGNDAKTNDVGFDMTSGSVNLTNGATLAVSSNYYQFWGSLTSDATVCTLDTGFRSPGDINIAGGKVVVDNVAGTVSTLKFIASTVEIDGEIDVSGLMTGGKSTQCDLLDCSGATVSLETNSALVVGTTGNGQLGTGNRWTVMQYASLDPNNDTWGVPPSVPPTMVASTAGTDVLVSN